MSIGEVTLTQWNDNIAYCRINRNGMPPGGAPNWDVSHDSEATSLGGTPFDLWQDPSDIVYIGKETTFAYVGFRGDTFGAGYGTFSVEFSISLNITGVNQGTKTFTIAESLASLFVAGVTFWIEGSTGNDNVKFTVASSSGTTDIIVDEAIPSAVVDGAIAWVSLNIFENNTILGGEGFGRNGYFAFSIPGSWSRETVDGTLSYWIRIYQSATPSVVATALHLLRNITLGIPLHVTGPEFTVDRSYRDINGTMRRRDFTYEGPNRYTVAFTQIALTQKNMLLLHDWEYYQNYINIQDGASTESNANDAYYSVLRGFITSVPPEMRSPGKMGLDVGAYYPLVFNIDFVYTPSILLGVT